MSTLREKLKKFGIIPKSGKDNEFNDYEEFSYRGIRLIYRPIHYFRDYAKETLENMSQYRCPHCLHSQTINHETIIKCKECGKFLAVLGAMFFYEPD